MTTFDDRERASGTLFVHGRERAVRARARRDRGVRLRAAPDRLRHS